VCVCVCVNRFVRISLDCEAVTRFCAMLLCCRFVCGNIVRVVRFDFAGCWFFVNFSPLFYLLGLCFIVLGLGLRVC